MRQSTTKYLLISLVTILFVSCAKQYYPGTISVVGDNSKMLNTFFTDTTNAYSYRATVQFGEQQLSGTLVIRTYHDDLRRIALVSDFGQTVLDLSLFKNCHVVNSMLPDLDNRFVTNELANIFRTLTQPYTSEHQLTTSESQSLYAVNLKGKTNYYQYQSNDLQTIEQYGRRKLRFTIRYGIQSNVVELIAIEHQRFPLQITMERQEKL